MASSGGTNLPPKFGGKKDSCWEYGERVEANNANKVRCKYCKQVLHGGITRLKQHLVGIKGNCVQCAQVPDVVKEKVKAILEKNQRKKEAKESNYQELMSDVHIGEEDEEDPAGEGEGSSRQSIFRPMKKVKGPLDKYSRSTEELVDVANKAKESKQPNMDSKFKKKAREDAVTYIAKWFYDAGIPFNTATLPSFQKMLQAIGKYGTFLEAPTPYELGETFLQREVEETNETLISFKQNCVINGCTLMTDAWSDRKNRSIMNIVAHCPAGMAFLHSQDASAEKHDGNYIYHFVDDAIKEIGPDNVVQIVTDNASNNMSAAKTLLMRRPNIYWTPCAAHTINLMLGDIGKIRPIRSAITMGRSVTVYIYSHTKSLSLMRAKTNGDIVRPGVTRFATAYLSLSSMREKKKDLKQMFVSNEWMLSTLSETNAGKKVYTFILLTLFVLLH